MTDDELALLDIARSLRDGVDNHTVSGDGVAAAAVLLDRAGVRPRSLTFLAEIVRAGGIDYAVRLAEPVPTQQASEVVRAWLGPVRDRNTVDDGLRVARWLDAVATVIAVRAG